MLRAYLSKTPFGPAAVPVETPCPKPPVNIIKQKKATDTLTLSDPLHFRPVRRAPLERDTKERVPKPKQIHDCDWLVEGWRVSVHLRTSGRLRCVRGRREGIASRRHSCFVHWTTGV